MLHMDVAKVDRDVAHVPSVLDECCKRLFKMFHLFQTFVSHICYKSMFQLFHLY
jgi:hypothetical protein